MQAQLPRTKFLVLPFAWGPSSLCHGRRAVSHTNHPGGLSALSLCSLKCSRRQVLTGMEEQSSTPASGVHIAGTALGAWQEPWTGRKDVQGCDGRAAKPPHYRQFWCARGTDQPSCGWKKKASLTTVARRKGTVLGLSGPLATLQRYLCSQCGVSRGKQGK